MTLHIPDAPVRRTISVWIAAVTAVVVAAVLALTPTRANAIATPVGLGTAGSFAVLAGSAVTNTGPSVVSGDLGVSPSSAITGFPPGRVVRGTIHQGDADAAQAQADLTTAYNSAAGQAPDRLLTGQDLGGLTLTPGVYQFASSAQLTGRLTLDAQGNPNAVWVFQIGSTLTTASGSNVTLINGASPCNVFWQVGSSATLGTGTDFVGTIMALTSITATTGAIIDGRALARNAAVTLDTNTISRGSCGTGTTGGTTGATSAGTDGGTTGATTDGGITGVPTSGGTGGFLGGLIGGVNGGVPDGHDFGKPGGHDHGKPDGHDHEKPDGHDHGKPNGHDHEKPDGHDHGGEPEEHGGYDGHGDKPRKDDGYDSVRS